MIGRQKNPSGHGAGKWQSTTTLKRYRAERNARNKAQKAARKRARR